MNATRTNPDRRAEKAQHHHSALVPSEYAAVCFSLSRALRGSSETKDRARLASHQDPHRTATDALKHLALLTAEPRQDWRRAMGDLLARLPRSLLSPPVRGPVCVVSTQTPRPQRKQKGPQAAKTQPGLRTIAELGETIVAVGEQLPRFRPWCGIEHQAARTRARPGAQPSATLFRAFGPSPLQGRRAAMQGRPAETSAVRRRRHTFTLYSLMQLSDVNLRKGTKTAEAELPG